MQNTMVDVKIAAGKRNKNKGEEGREKVKIACETG